MAAVLFPTPRSGARVCSASKRTSPVPPMTPWSFSFLTEVNVGVSAAGNGITNVCGLCRESALKRLDFDHDALLHSNDPLRERLGPLRREMEWLSAGALQLENHFHHPPQPGGDRAGDALSFLAPFHGSGMFGALG